MTKITQHGAITALQPVDSIMVDTIDDIDRTLSPRLSGGVPNLVLDMSDVTLIDSAGLEWILDLDDACSGRGGCLRLCSVGELCQDILRVTSVGDQVQQFKSLTEALSSFN